MRVFTFLILMVAGAAIFAAYPFLLEVKEQEVEARGQQMCERILKANELAQLYPVPDFVDCSCYAKALANNYSPAQGAAFLNKKRDDALTMIKRMAGTSGPMPSNSAEDSEIFATIFKACRP